MAWQDIETAPKDRSVLLKMQADLDPRIAVCVGRWVWYRELLSEPVFGWGESALLLGYTRYIDGVPSGILFRGHAVAWHEIPV